MKELVLTGLYELWPDTADKEKAALYLGPWCFAGNHKDFIADPQKFSVLSHPWKDAKDLAKAQAYLDDLIERLLPCIADEMNAAFSLNFSKRFWSIIFISWLLHWLTHIYERYITLKHSIKLAQTPLRVKIVPDIVHSIRNVEDFFYIQSTHEYNLMLYTDILLQMKKKWSTCFELISVNMPKIKCVEKVSYVRDVIHLSNLFSQFDQPKLAVSVGENIIEVILYYFRKKLGILSILKLPLKGAAYLLNYMRKNISKYRFLFRLCGMKRAIFLMEGYGISAADVRNLKCLNANQFDQILRNLPKQEYVDVRKKFLGTFKPLNEFESIVKAVFAKYIPNDLLCYIPIPRWMVHKKIWIGNEVWNPTLRRVAIAHIVEYGGKWLSRQHGGGYGEVKVFPAGLVEHKYSDGFISWGWDYAQNYQTPIFNLASPQLSILKKVKRTHPENLYLITTMYLAYCYRYHSSLQPWSLGKYIEDKINFLVNLDYSIKRKTKYRPFHYEYGINDMKNILEYIQFSAIVWDSQEHNERLSNSRLVVIDHCSTSYLEALCMNVPTVLFWDPKIFVVHEEAQLYFDELRKVEILHDNALEAAQHVNRIWDDVDDWWMRDDVQKARANFCNNYARTSENWQEEWSIFLRDLRKGKIKLQASLPN